MERGVLGRDAGTTKDGDGSPAIVLTCTAQSCEEVAALLAAAAAAGGQITAAAAETPGGGYGGHFSDPDGFSWKVTH
jgi:predicted lactoylglutathione lyase